MWRERARVLLSVISQLAKFLKKCYCACAKNGPIENSGAIKDVKGSRRQRTMTKKPLLVKGESNG